MKSIKIKFSQAFKVQVTIEALKAKELLADFSARFDDQLNV